nr:MAG TPA: hypothetical protein [Caudoviricetes sp.]
MSSLDMSCKLPCRIIYILKSLCFSARTLFYYIMRILKLYVMFYILLLKL